MEYELIINKECIICFENIDTDNNNYIKCDTCNCYYHPECIITWKNKTGNSICPTCQVDNLKLFKIIYPKCCFFWRNPFSSNKIIRYTNNF